MAMYRYAPFPSVTFLWWGGTIVYCFTSYREILKGLFSFLFLLLATERQTAAPHNFLLVSAPSWNLILTSSRDFTTLQLPIAKAFPVPERLLGSCSLCFGGITDRKSAGPKSSKYLTKILSPEELFMWKKIDSEILLWCRFSLEGRY